MKYTIMKKRDFSKKLSLNKSIVSNLNDVKGGLWETELGCYDPAGSNSCDRSCKSLCCDELKPPTEGLTCNSCTC